MLLVGVAAGMAQEADLSKRPSSAKSKPIKVYQQHINFGRARAPIVETTTVSNPGSQPAAISISPPSAPFSLTSSSGFSRSQKFRDHQRPVCHSRPHSTPVYPGTLVLDIFRRYVYES